MRPSSPLPADAASRGTLFDRARAQGFAQELTERVVGEVRKQRKREKRMVRSIGVSLLLVGFGFWAVPYFRSTDSLTTRPANRQTLALNDGSRAELNAQTELKTDFRYGRRTVRLTSGEAFFTVTKDTEHPFLVETAAGTVKVTGTQFNVRLLPDQSAEVTLVEGSVEVKQGDKERMLTPGNQLTFGEGRDQFVALQPAEMESVTAWREGRLILDELTVAEAAARMARYHGKAIAVEPDAAGVRLGGSCPLDDLPAFLQALRATQAITILEQRDGSYRLIRQRP